MNNGPSERYKGTNHTYLLAGVEYRSTLASCTDGPILIPGCSRRGLAKKDIPSTAPEPEEYPMLKDDGVQLPRNTAKHNTNTYKQRLKINNYQRILLTQNNK